MRSRNEWVAVLLLAACAVPVAWTTPAAGDEVAELREQLARQQAVNQALKAVVEELRAEVDNLRQEIRATHADRDRLLREFAKQRDELQKTRADLDRVFRQLVRQEEIDSAKFELAHLRRWVAKVEALAQALHAEFARGAAAAPAPGASRAADPVSAPKELDGVVLAVYEDGIVEISLGEDDGLRAGHKLEVIRKQGDQSIYVGRIEVVRTTPDRVACKVIPEFERRKVQKGDVVLSSL